MEQIKLVSETQDMEAVSKTPQNLTSDDNLSRLQGMADWLANNGNAQELAVLLGKDLPVSYKIDDQADIDATLSSLTEALQLVLTASAAEQGVQLNQAQAIAAPNGLVSENPTDDPVVSADAIEVIKQMLATVISPGHESQKFTVEAASKGTDLAFVAINPDEAIQRDSSERMEFADDSQQTNNAFRQMVQEGQGLSGLRKAGLTEDIGQSGPGAGIETENTLPRGTADFIQHNKQIFDSRADVPAMTKPVGHPEWNKELGERILWMHNKTMPAAEIKLNPQHLGPISVRIDMNQDQATVTFTSSHAAVREALEASMPKLRELMSAQQINLADVNVFQNPSEQRQSLSQGYEQSRKDWEQGAGQGSEDGMIGVMEETDNNDAVVSKGLLSLYV
jgi:flagellar hook-length control protein FliK